MDYLIVRQIVERWNLSERRMVQQFCMQGCTPGAQKFGTFWTIPFHTENWKIPLKPAGKQ